jgi:hypothetical protein
MQLRVVVRLLIVEAVRSLARNVVRSGLAMLGIAVAVAIVITVIALGRASIEASEAELDKLGDNLVWIEAGSRNVAGARTGTHGMTTLTARDADAIRHELGERRRRLPRDLPGSQLAHAVARRRTGVPGDQALGARGRRVLR